MKTIRKILCCLGGMICLFSLVFPVDTFAVPASFGGGDSNFSGALKSGDGFGTNKTMGGVGVAGSDEEYNGNADIIQVIKNALNWGLSILGFVALVLCLFGGFMITTAAGDDGKVSKGKKILTQAGIGLAVIALSGLIVNLIFYVIKGSAG